MRRTETKPGPPKRWDPEGFNRIVEGLTKKGKHPNVASLAAEYALLKHKDGSDPTGSTWVTTSQTARFCAAAIQPAFDRLTADQVHDDDAYDHLAGALAEWFDLFDDDSPEKIYQAAKVLASV